MKISVEIFNSRKTFNRIFSDDVRKYAHTRLHAYCSQYVPGGSGGMLNTVKDITKDYVHYKSPYAHYQWEGELYLAANGSSYAGKNESKHPAGKPLKYHTPGTTSHWERAAMVAKKEQLASDVEAYIKRK